MDALAAYALDQHRRGLRPSTIVTRRGVLRSLERWLPGPIEAARPDEIEQWLDSRRLSTRSRYAYLSTVASFFEFARRRGFVRRDPTVDIVRPRLARLVPRPAVAEDVEYAIGEAVPMMAAWLCLAAYQGLRCMEIAQLRREDVVVDHDPPLLVVADGKGGHQAVLPLSLRVELALRDHGLPRSGLVFVTRDGSQYKPATVSRYMSGFLRSVGVDATAHQLRHRFCSTLWERTHDLRLVQEMARHSDPKTTAGYTAFDSARAASVLRDLALVVRPVPA